MKINYLYDNLTDSSKNKNFDEISIDNLFEAFENSVEFTAEHERNKNNSIQDVIDSSVEKVIEELAIRVIDTESSLLGSKNVTDVINSIENLIIAIK